MRLYLGKYLLLALFLLIGLAESKIGKKCSSSSACSRRSDILMFESIVDCIDDVCQCKPGIEVSYEGSSLRPDCNSNLYSLKVVYGKCNETTCGQNASCEHVKDKGSIWSSLKKKICYCNEGFLRVAGACREANHQSVLQSCGLSTSGIRSCDLERYSYCSDGKCVCFDTFFANTTSGKCEPISNFLEAYNLTEYRVKPGEYCADDRHCIPGLDCRSFECSCPSPCTYNSTAEICDCGMVTFDVGAAIGPIILGIILGMLIIAFWVFMIRRTIRKFAAKKTEGFSNLDTSAQNSPSLNTYALHPVNPIKASNGVNDGPPAGLTVPSPSGGGRQSPVSNTFLLYKPGGEDTSGPPPPQASLYGINPPQAPPPSYSINSDTPPMYTDTPSATDLPPSYSINPSPMGSSSAPLPYPSNPTDSISALPYPSNPSVLPYPPSPSASPYPVSSPSAPYPPGPGGTPSESHTAPPAYNPSYP